MSEEAYYAYYFTLHGTSDNGVDSILEEVARAGKAYHHTRGWGPEYDHAEGESPAEKIQAVANDVANASADRSALLAKALGALEAALERLHVERDGAFCAELEHGYAVLDEARRSGVMK